MTPVKFKEHNLIIAKDQKDYTPIPAHQFRDEYGRIAFCWRMTFLERVKVLFTGLVWHEVLTFNSPLHPQKLGVKKPDMENTND